MEWSRQILKKFTFFIHPFLTLMPQTSETHLVFILFPPLSISSEGSAIILDAGEGGAMYQQLGPSFLQLVARARIVKRVLFLFSP